MTEITQVAAVPVEVNDFIGLCRALTFLVRDGRLASLKEVHWIAGAAPRFVFEVVDAPQFIQLAIDLKDVFKKESQ